MKTPPKIQVDTMPAGQFFAYAAEILKLQPPHLTDQPIIVLMRRIGIEPGKSFDLDKADPAVKQALESVTEDARRLMAWKLKTLANVMNNWSMNTNTMGVYGDYYLKRAIVTQLGLGANVPEDAIYPINLGDEAAGRLMEPISTSCTSIRARHRPRPPFGQSHFMTRMDIKLPIRSTASRSAAGCHFA